MRFRSVYRSRVSRLKQLKQNAYSCRRRPLSLARRPSGGHNRTVFRRFLYGPDGQLRIGRLMAVVPLCFVAAMFGPVLLWLVPQMTDNEVWRWTGVVLVTFMFKIPLIMLVYMFIRRNMELPTKPPIWDDSEIGHILAALRRQSDEAMAYEDASARLEYLSREAWNVADRASGSTKTDALTVALQIDERLMDLTKRKATQQ